MPPDTHFPSGSVLFVGTVVNLEQAEIPMYDFSAEIDDRYSLTVWKEE